MSLMSPTSQLEDSQIGEDDLFKSKNGLDGVVSTHASFQTHTKTSKIKDQGRGQFGGSFRTASVSTDLKRWLMLRHVCDANVPQRREACPEG